MKIGIAGAGLAGRLLAIACLKRNWHVTLFDQGDKTGQHSCGWVAAGMLAPFTELESSEPLIAELGLQALSLWPEILEQLILPVSFHRSGTLVVAHPQDAGELTRFEMILQHKYKTPLQRASREKLTSILPGLSPSIRDGFWMPEEGYIDSVEFFAASTATLQARNVQWHENTFVTDIQPKKIITEKQTHHFDLVCDCRGLGAKQKGSDLRGVRGEIVWLETTEVELPCPIRLLHPRYPIYISPRAQHRFVVGATSIESEDKSPISVESMLELLSAACTVHPSFAEARIVNSLTQCRPAFADHLPKIEYETGLLKINGLYRHGYLIGPAVIHKALKLVEETVLCKSS